MLKGKINNEEFIILNSLEEFRIETKRFSQEWYKAANLKISYKVKDIEKIPSWYEKIKEEQYDLIETRLPLTDVFPSYAEYLDYEDNFIEGTFCCIAEEIIKDKNYSYEIIKSELLKPEELDDFLRWEEKCQ